MKLFQLLVGKRQFFIYSFPETADEQGNFDLTLLTDSDFCATSVSSPSGSLFFLYNLSKEKQTIPTVTPTVNPITSGNGGTPYFFPLPWELEAGTIIRMVPTGTIEQVSIAGYRVSK